MTAGARGVRESWRRGGFVVLWEALLTWDGLETKRRTMQVGPWGHLPLINRRGRWAEEIGGASGDGGRVTRKKGCLVTRSLRSRS